MQKVHDLQTSGRRLLFVLATTLSLGAAPATAEQPSLHAAADPDNGAAILMYHRFGEDSLPTTSVRLEQFEAHLAELGSGRYRVLPLPEIVARLHSGEALPDRAVAITIDDAALSVYSEAWPRLKAAGLPFTLFVSTEPLDLSLGGYMSWEQLREMAADPLVTVGNHGHSHAHMAWQDAAAQHSELEQAAARLQTELGSAPTLFAYPYGEMSLALRQNVIGSNFAAAFGQHSGAAGATSDRFFLPRFPLNEAYGDMERFRLVANTLPLPVDGITPADTAIAEPAQNPPNFGFTVTASLGNLDALQCFASAGAPEMMRLGERIELRFATDFPAGRARINCTLPAEGGRWRWFGTQFVVSKRAAP
ncbi:polysaccharide deacetylase family protein [Pelagibius sp. 7325]|uniref:polysaccharide deacetylase family protein n=1 Tax=Pelagibius sp. 7325 TaxID=3131994 RepID=UPI0030EC22F1